MKIVKKLGSALIVILVLAAIILVSYFAVSRLVTEVTGLILDFPDLTVDGSFPLGAAVTATMIPQGVNPYLTIPVSFLDITG